MNDLFFGLDIGRSDVKAKYGPEESDVLVFPSYVAPYRQRDLKSDSTGLDNLEVYVDGQSRFVGELAREMNGTKEFGSNKIDHENTRFLLLAAIASSPVVKSFNTVYPRIVVGLPISNYTAQASAFERKLAGEYTVILPGKRVTIILRKENILAFQECVGVYYDLLLDSEGQPARADLIRKTVGIIDIGFKTVHILKMIKGKYADSASTTLERIGMNDAFLAFYKRLVREKSYTPNEVEQKFLEEGLQEKKELAQKIEGQMAPWWPEPSEFDEIIFAGGGGQALAKYFRNYNGVLAPHPQTGNASGFRKVAVAKLKG